MATKDRSAKVEDHANDVLWGGDPDKIEHADAGTTHEESHDGGTTAEELDVPVNVEVTVGEITQLDDGDADGAVDVEVTVGEITQLDDGDGIGPDNVEVTVGDITVLDDGAGNQVDPTPDGIKTNPADAGTFGEPANLDPGSVKLDPSGAGDRAATIAADAGLAPPTSAPTTGGTSSTAPPSPAPPSGASPTTSSSTSSSGSQSSSDGGRPDAGYTPPPDDGANDRPSSSTQVTSTKTDREFESHTPATEGGHGDSAIDTKSHTDEYQNSDGTWTYVTTTTTTNTETGETETSAPVSETTDTRRQQDVDDDPGGYSYTGPAPLEQTGIGDTAEVSDGASHQQMAYSGVYGTFFGTPEHAHEGNPHTVWGDYGNPTDENAAVGTKEDGGPPSTDPLIHVEPDADGGTAAISIEQHEFQASIHGGDFGNPNDPLFGDGNVPAGDGNDTSPYEHDTGDSAASAFDDDGLP